MSDAESEAASLLLRLLDELPEQGGRDRALRHRLAGAAVALLAASESKGSPDARSPLGIVVAEDLARLSA